ncbi:MAG: AarF/ABC1/UbiB kinase family protein [Bacteroidales bacterium]|nr:AarF/ABC1/UbiB kinase family protein [Bacteroidales bacterium]
MIRKIGINGKRYRHLNRYVEVVKVLAKYGFDDIVSQSKLDSVVELGKKIAFKKSDKIPETLSRWERIRMVIEELGPTFVKFGQIISTRPDLIPLELITELKKLQDSVPPFAQEKAISIIEQELGKPIDELFSEYIAEPIAAASIAQVHKAILHNGEEVAIKIQRPDIDQIIETDLEIMFFVATMIEKYIEGLKNFSLTEIVKELETSIRKELNFSLEMANLERFGNNFQKNPNIYVPKCYENLSTKKILTLEFIDGIKISDIESIEAHSLDRKIIAKRGTDLVLKQIFEFGFFHADPHPGNVLILPENVFCYLDFGMMGSLSHKTRELISSLIIGAVSHDIEKIAKNVIKLCEPTGEIKIKKLESQLDSIIDKYFNQSLENIDMTELVNELVKFFPENNLRMPADMYLLGRSLLLMQSSGELLDPDYNIANQTEPYIKKMLKDRYSAKKMAKDMFASTDELLLLAKELPFEIRGILEKIKTGTLKTEIEHKGLNPLIGKHEQTVNRLTFAIVLASIILGSALVINSKIPPLWHEIPIIGLAGLVIATIMGFALLISIYRHGKM